MTKTAVLSDIHGNLPALLAVVADAQARGCTRFLNLGDILSGPLWPSETAAWLMAREWPTIAGNHERQVLSVVTESMNASDSFTRAALGPEALSWMAGLPATLVLGDLFLCHGTPASDVAPLTDTLEGNALRVASTAELEARLEGRGEGLTLCGHTHIPRLLTCSDGRRVLNPGSVGLQAFDDDYPRPYTVENGDPRARYAVIDGDAITLHVIAYDHRAAAAKAEAEGRADWAIGLATGRMR
jgi:predicted phosphodiesterase